MTVGYLVPLTGHFFDENGLSTELYGLPRNTRWVVAQAWSNNSNQPSFSVRSKTPHPGGEKNVNLQKMGHRKKGTPQDMVLRLKITEGTSIRANQGHKSTPWVKTDPRDPWE